MPKDKSKHVESLFSEKDMPQLPTIKNFQDDLISNLNRKIGPGFVKVKENKGKKKTKHQKEEIRITSKGGVLKPGRHACDCEGSMHEVLTNCFKCGKIICEQERYGKCFYCKNEVVEPTKLYQEKKTDLNFVRAIDLRNRLVEYDKNFAKRTTVYDDNIDYFESSSDPWMTEEERADKKVKEEKLKELKESAISRRKRLKFTFDFAGRKILVEDDKTEEEIDKLIKELSLSTSTSNKTGETKQKHKEIAHPSVVLSKPKYQEVSKKKKKSNKLPYSNPTSYASAVDASRVQHSYFSDDENDNQDINNNEDVDEHEEIPESE